MSNPVTLGFTLNGHPVQVTAPGAAPLLFVLRNDLGLQGTRLGCGTGDCGACTVTLDGQPVSACTLPFSSVAGKSIGTVEGLTGAEPHPLVTALLRHQAGQCGYCLPGILTRAAALIDQGHTLEQITLALDANLCRCGAHPRILAAISDTIAKRGAVA